MKQYLLDTNIVIFLFKGLKNIGDKIDSVGLKNCFISEITLAELEYGALKSQRLEHHLAILNEFLEEIEVLPIYNAISIYASERVRLERLGTRIDDFDLLIGATAVANSLVIVTNNVAHFERILGIEIEDWLKL